MDKPKLVSWDEVIEAWNALRANNLTLFIENIIQPEYQGHRYMIFTMPGCELMVDLDTPMRVAHRGGLRAVLETL